MPSSFFEFSRPELESRLLQFGKERFRAQQLYQWVYHRRVEAFSQMSNLALALRSELEAIWSFPKLEVASHLISSDGTRKWLYQVEGGTIETVLIPNKDRLTLCVSSEIGCNMACRFCYTGKQKLKRRLTAGEIVAQFLGAQDELAREGKRVTNIVFMGMGEPLDNPDAVFRAIQILHDPAGINFSRKKITVSTSGLVPLIPLVTQAGVRLAVSLNAPNDRIRDEVMPINKKWNIAELLKACKNHADASGDRVTVEYVLLRDVTDRIEHARELFALTRSVPCKINLIPFNEHPGSDFMRPTPESVVRFQNELMRLGAHVLLRKTMGRDIFAACGQLTSLYSGRPERMSQVTQA